ncbi:MAG TPA: DUF4129 domain-containing protein [Mycobacteriales bacterium]|jgi:hypothetical protein|nr:DUF4129 domain-containing protein [Mycobacteriales bacterium]
MHRPAALTGRAVVGVTAATAGLVLAALSARQSSFLAPDVAVQEVDAIPATPFEMFRPTGPPRQLPLPLWLAPTIETVLQLLLVLLAVVVVVAVGTAVVRGLIGIRRLMLPAETGEVVPPEYDPGEGTEEDVATELRRRLRESVEVGAEELRAGTDPADAVLACYVAMERAAAAAGTERQPHETPEDLLRRMLAAHHVDPASARELTALYEGVRFGARVTDESMRQRALRCLDSLRAGLAVGA